MSSSARGEMRHDRNSAPYDLRAPVTENLDLGGGYFLTSLRAQRIASNIHPGQFVMVGTPDITQLLLRRPFSVCLVRTGPSGAEEVRLLYRIVGRGTALLSALTPGTELTVLGPLGKGFTDPTEGETPLMIAGGVGSAAFPFLLERFRERGMPVVLCYGAKSAADLPMLDWFRERGEVHVTTEDGSAGERAVVTAPVERLLSSGRRFHLYSCGPEPMLRAVARLAAARRLASEAALEAFMACGFGVCLGCVVEAARPAGEYGRFRRVCLEGPVFQTSEIRW